MLPFPAAGECSKARTSAEARAAARAPAGKRAKSLRRRRSPAVLQVGASYALRHRGDKNCQSHAHAP